MEENHDAQSTKSFKLTKGNRQTNRAGIVGIFIILMVGIYALNEIRTPIPPNSQPTQQTTSTPVQPTTQPQEQRKEESSQREIDAKVNFSSSAFMITNNEESEWKACKFEMNAEGFKNGYIYRNDLVKAKDAIIIPFSEFTKGDGTRFNVSTTKPQNISISCDDVGGKRGWNYFTI